MVVTMVFKTIEEQQQAEKKPITEFLSVFLDCQLFILILS